MFWIVVSARILIDFSRALMNTESRADDCEAERFKMKFWGDKAAIECISEVELRIVRPFS